MTTPIYLDNHSTTIVAPEVLQGMLPYFCDTYGNPNSPNAYGWSAKEAVEEARNQLASLLGCTPREVYFTSGATEANNWALQGLSRQLSYRGHIITSNIEHKSILEVCNWVEKQGMQVTYLPVNATGQISPNQVAEAIRPNTVLVSLMAANNEIGTIFPIAEVGKICKQKEVLLHVDAAQAVGKMAIDVEIWGADLVSLSAHKFHGPKGVGALYIRRKNPRVRIQPLMFGGSQESGQRPGTLNVPGIVGMGIACTLINLGEQVPNMLRLRDLMINQILSAIPKSKLNGCRQQRLANNINMTLPLLHPGESLLTKLPQLAFNTGSACTSGSGEMSHVLRAIGLDRDTAKQTARFGLSRYTQEKEIQKAIEILQRLVT